MVLYIEYRHRVRLQRLSYVCHNALTSQDFIIRTRVATQRVLIEVDSRNDMCLMPLFASSPLCMQSCHRSWCSMQSCLGFTRRYADFKSPALRSSLLGQRANAFAMLFLSSVFGQAIVSPIARIKQGYVCTLVSKHTLMPHCFLKQLDIYIYI